MIFLDHEMADYPDVRAKDRPGDQSLDFDDSELDEDNSKSLSGRDVLAVDQVGSSVDLVSMNSLGRREEGHEGEGEMVKTLKFLLMEVNEMR